MTRRLPALLLFSLLLFTGAAAASTNDLREEQAAIQDKIARIKQKIEWANSRETVLTSEITAVTSRIRAFEDGVQRATSELRTLESELAVHKNRLALLTRKYRLQTERLGQLREDYAAAEARLFRRIVAIYQEEETTAVDVVLRSRSFAEMLDQLDYLQDIGQQDRVIARQVARAKGQMWQARRETNLTRKDVTTTAKEVEVRLDRQLEERNRLLAAQNQLASARNDKQRTLAKVEASERDFHHELDGLEKSSAELSAKILAAQSRSSGVSYSGSGTFIWPVSGPVTSTFGWRWGRMHEGIDIGAPSGAPIVAAGPGTVIFAGWMGGYGQLVVVDHGGGVATAYAHMSQLGSGVGQQVAQGQVIGYIGCTGHCYGSHLHFEVRVNGAARDPLGYL
jgi:murein DD-endopeptidase MepM/ murein hydrolase activator NlpD